MRENRKREKKNEKLLPLKNNKVYTHKSKAHKNFVTSISWRPYHLDDTCNLFVSSSKDFSVRFWDFALGKCITGGLMHKKSVTKVIWGG